MPPALWITSASRGVWNEEKLDWAVAKKVVTKRWNTGWTQQPREKGSYFQAKISIYIPDTIQKRYQKLVSHIISAVFFKFKYLLLCINSTVRVLCQKSGFGIEVWNNLQSVKICGLQLLLLAPIVQCMDNPCTWRVIDFVILCFRRLPSFDRRPQNNKVFVDPHQVMGTLTEIWEIFKENFPTFWG